jgi:hypothetical protein
MRTAPYDIGMPRVQHSKIWRSKTGWVIIGAFSQIRGGSLCPLHLPTGCGATNVSCPHSGVPVSMRGLWPIVRVPQSLLSQSRAAVDLEEYGSRRHRQVRMVRHWIVVVLATKALKDRDLRIAAWPPENFYDRTGT